jgi:hypothetical protein
MKDPAWMSGDLTPDQRAWERWAEQVRVGDRCEVDFKPGVVQALGDDLVTVLLDGDREPVSVEWWQCGPVVP